MNKEEIAAKVQRLVADHLCVAESQVTHEKGLIADLGSDSLDIVEMVMVMEDDFGIEIPNDDSDKFVTVGDCIEYVQRRLE